MPALLFACTNFAVSAQTTDSGQVFIVPADAGGNPVEDAETEMTRTADDTFSATGVEIDYGFWIYGHAPSTGLSTHYSIPAWAERTVIIGWLNPLSGTGDSYIPVPASGTYDISFYSRQDTGYSLSMCKVEYSSDPDATTYPEAIYLVPSSGDKVRIAGTDGIYTGTVALPAQFKIAYEPSYNYEAFIFGPASGDATVSLEAGTPVELKYAENTSSTFSYATTYGVDSDGKTTVTVDLASPTRTITVLSGIQTSVEGVATDSAETVSDMYDVYGRRIAANGTMRPGVYIVRYASGHTGKLLVH